MPAKTCGVVQEDAAVLAGPLFLPDLLQCLSLLLIRCTQPSMYLEHQHSCSVALLLLPSPKWQYCSVSRPKQTAHRVCCCHDGAGLTANLLGRTACFLAACQTPL